ncbi:MAG: hypothetical protein Q7K03_05250 [Dehalococcoidia bacterium]|nr:hypothetical protein [Dehalococcoidia bacterium]
MHEAFREHIRRTDLWGQLHQYQTELATYLQMRQEIQQALKVPAETLAKQMHPTIRLHDWSQTADRLLEARLRSPSPGPLPKAELRSAPDQYWVHAESYVLIPDPVPEALTHDVQNAFVDFWPSAKAMLPSWQGAYNSPWRIPRP